MTQVAEQDDVLLRRTGLYRLLIGAAQGLALYLLSKAFAHHTDNIWLAGAFCAALLAPAVALAEVSRMPVRWLALWFVVAAAVLALLGVWSAWRDGLSGPYEMALIFRLGLVLPAGAVLLFVAHHLVAVGSEARRWIAPFPAYFDSAWRHALQVALSGLFLGIFWAVLFLGAFLFELIGQTFLQELIKHDWFWIPVSTVVFAGAVHLTDVRIAPIRGFRTVVLTLFAVLLPLVAGLSALFLVVGAATGMRGVWTAQAAAATLLTMALAMIVFLNAAYQDGAEERRPGAILRWTMRIAPFLIVALALLCAGTVLVLVLRHGWTPERIVALAAALVVSAHGAGYAWAALGRGRFMAGLEPTNILAAHLTLVIGLVLLSPVGDPARLSAADQMARLTSGKVRPEQFDFNFLAQRSARFGLEALAKLAKSPDIRLSHLALAAARREPYAANGQIAPLTPADIAGLIQLYPAGSVLPPRFLPTILDRTRSQTLAFGLPACLQAVGQCVGYLIDLDHDGKPELILWQENDGAVFKEAADGRWGLAGSLTYCSGVADGLRAGLVAAAPPPLDDIDVDGAKLRVIGDQTTACTTATEAQKTGAKKNSAPSIVSVSGHVTRAPSGIAATNH